VNKCISKQIIAIKQELITDYHIPVTQGLSDTRYSVLSDTRYSAKVCLHMMHFS